MVNRFDHAQKSNPILGGYNAVLRIIEPVLAFKSLEHPFVADCEYDTEDVAVDYLLIVLIFKKLFCLVIKYYFFFV